MGSKTASYRNPHAASSVRMASTDGVELIWVTCLIWMVLGWAAGRGTDAWAADAIRESEVRLVMAVGEAA